MMKMTSSKRRGVKLRTNLNTYTIHILGGKKYGNIC